MFIFDHDISLADDYYLCGDTTKISEHFCYPKSENLMKCRSFYSSELNYRESRSKACNVGFE